MNELKLEYVIIIFLLILAIVILFYKSLDTSKPITPKHNITPILKKETKIKTNNNVKFYDVRMSKLSNDINIILTNKTLIATGFNRGNKLNFL